MFTSLDSLDVLAMLGYFVLIAVFGYLTRRTKTFTEFSVGGHSVPATMVFASLAATIVGPGFSVGFTSKGWSSGFLFYYLALSYAVQVILVGLFFAPRLSRHRDCRSLGDVMRKKYGTAAQIVTGIVSVATCIGFTAVIGRTGAGMLAEVTGWPLLWCLIAVTGATTLLTFTGGVRATIATEGLQFALFSVVIPATLIAAVVRSPETLAQISARASNLTHLAADKMEPLQILGVALAFMLGEALIPPYANRALSARSAAASRTGFLLAGGYCVIWLAIVAVLGVVARGILPSATVNDDAFVAIGRQVLPVGIFGLLLAALVAIVMSSQESVLNSGAVVLVRDIAGPVLQLSEKDSLVLAKISTVAIGVASVYVGQYTTSVIDGLLNVYSLWAPTMLLSLLLGLYIESTRPLAAWLSMSLGGCVCLVWQFGLHEPNGIPTILVGLTSSALGYLVGHLAGRPFNASQLSELSPA
jgi:SSS family solute:Na+ symporter